MGNSTHRKKNEVEWQKVKDYKGGCYLTFIKGLYPVLYF